MCLHVCAVLVQPGLCDYELFLESELSQRRPHLLRPIACHPFSVQCGPLSIVARNPITKIARYSEPRFLFTGPLTSPGTKGCVNASGGVHFGVGGRPQKFGEGSRLGGQGHVARLSSLTKHFNILY